MQRTTGNHPTRNHRSLLLAGGLTLGLATSLTGCGGGNIKILSPTAEQVFLQSDEVAIQVAFDNVNPLDARFVLNGNDITADVVIDPATKRATATLPAATILDERSQLQINAGAKSKSVRFFVDRSAPEVVVTRVTPAANAPNTSLTIEGYVTDLSAIQKEGGDQPQLRYGVNAGDLTHFFELDADNRFSVNVTTVPMGNEEPASLESAPLRFLVTDETPAAFGLLTSNDTYAPANRQPPFARAHVSALAFANTINPEINAVIDGLDIEAMIKARNPVVDVSGVLSDIPGVPEVTIPIPVIDDPNLLGLGMGLSVRVDNLDMASLDVDVAPVSASKPTLVTQVDLDDLDLRVNTSISIELPALPDPAIPFSSSLTNANVHGDVTVALKIMGNDTQAPRLAVDSVDIDLDVTGGDIDLVSFDGLPWPLDVALGTLAEIFIGAVEQYAFEKLEDPLLDLIGDAVKDKVIRQVNKELNLLPSDYTVGLRNRQFSFALTEADIATSADGLSVTLSRGDVAAAPMATDSVAEPGWQLNEGGDFASFAPTTPTENLPYEVGLSLDWDFLNKTLYQAHGTGIDRFGTTFAGSSVPVVGNQLRNLEFRVQVKPVLAPYLDQPIPRATPALASVNAKEVSVALEYRDTTKAEDFHQAAEIRANVRMDVDLGVAANKLQPKLDADPDIRIQSFSINAGETRLNEAVLQKLVDFIMPQAMPLLVDVLGTIRLPCIKGRSLDVLEVEPGSGGYFNVYANVTANAAACPAGPDVAPPPAPTVHVEFSGCDGPTPEFTVDVFSNGKATDEIRVELKQAGGNFRRFTGSTYFGISNQNDVFRAQACNEYGCGTYGTDSTGRQRCGGGGGNPPTQPL
ncbi:MAG: hypothetical protein ACOY7J_02195 [Pseudomonadota bacterium]